MTAEDSVHPDLKEVAFEMWFASLNYEENKGNSELAPVYWEIFERKRKEYRAARAELAEKLGVAEKDL